MKWGADNDSASICNECYALYDGAISKNLAVVLQDMIDEYIKFYRLDKKFIEWDDHDLDEMGEQMHDWIYKRQVERKKAERRVSYMVLRRLKVLRNRD